MSQPSCKAWLPALVIFLAAGTSGQLVGCAADYKKLTLPQVQELRDDHDTGVVVVDEPHTSFREVLERSPTAQSLTRITDLSTPEIPGEFAISADGKSIVYQAIDTAAEPLHCNLWRKETSGGGGATKLTDGRYLDIQPAIDFPGRYVYFSSNRGSMLHSIWRISMSGGGGIARVTGGESMDLWPHVNPTANEIYYTSRPVNAMGQQIWRIGSNGSLPTQLREGTRPRVSPDGTAILYCAVDGKTGDDHIWVMTSDGTDQTQLTTRSGRRHRDPSWSWCGKKIVYASDESEDATGRRNFDIWIMKSDGSAQTRLTTNGSTDLAPALDPTGQFVYFLSNRGFEWNIWRLGIGDTRRLARSSRDLPGQ